MSGLNKITCFFLVLCVNLVVIFAQSDEASSSCCRHGQIQATQVSSKSCTVISPPKDIDDEDLDTCKTEMKRCCDEQLKDSQSCSSGVKLANAHKCETAKSDIEKTCCDECLIGRWVRDSQGQDGCESPGDLDDPPHVFLKKQAHFQCCMQEPVKPETTTEKKIETTTTKKPIKCKKSSCGHLCDDSGGVIRCYCREGYRLQRDNKSCSDINECMEADEDLCTAENTVCHNTPGSFKCVPLKSRTTKRDVGSSCPPGFKKNVLNQVCDDINECQLPRPPCPKYLCENTIGGYKCSGKPGKPVIEAAPGSGTEQTTPIAPERNDICPPGFRAGPDEECIDIDECQETLDDCQHLSQHCINTHGGFFCQDHVSKRCAPGFKVNSATGICEDIDECEESSEVCKRTEVCVNLPGAYNCKSKISTLPKLATKNCQEGTRLRLGGSVCEDIDECREGTHLCDDFQNCINTFGAHECRCKNGFELDSSSGSCVDIDECALKLDNCSPRLHCLNNLGSFTCTYRPPSTEAPPLPEYEYEYYDTDDENGTDTVPQPVPVPTTSSSTTTTTRRTTTSTTTTTTPKPTPRPRPRYPYPDRPRYTTPRKPNDTPRRTTPTTPVTPATPVTPKTPATPATPTTSMTETTPVRPEYKPTRPEYYPRRPQPTPARPGTSSRRPESTTSKPVTTETRPDSTPTWPEPTPTIPGYTPTRPEYTPTRPDYTPTRPEYTPTRPDYTQTRPDHTPTRPEYTPTRPEHTPTRPEYTPTRPEYTPTRPDYTPTRPEYTPTRPDYTPTRPDYTPTRPETTRKPSTTSSLPTTPKATTNFDDNNIDSNLIPNTDDNEVKPETPGVSAFDPKDVHCLNGYEKDAYGKCIDINECESGRHICSNLEDCVNQAGGYHCECTGGYTRSDDGWCVPITTSSTTSTTTSTTTPKSTSVTFPERPYTPSWPRGSRVYPACELGYTYDTKLGLCVDIDECASNKATCSSKEDCINIEGGFRCVCGKKCHGETDDNPYGTSLFNPPSPPVPPVISQPDANPNVITVGAQYGQRGPWSTRPSFTRLLDSGAVVSSCPWGYKLKDKRCYDIDECARNVSDCGPQQRCENFYGGYSCQCPAGHRLVGQNSCDDIDECRHGNPCSYNAQCVNTVGSYRCACEAGFRNAPSNDKVCVDVDECADTPPVCQHGCANAWGGYRCYCKRGYRLHTDNSTCVDVNECEEWSSVRIRGKLCAGECVNEPGSYRCSCPAGYRLSEDARSCIDINECETGEAPCARSSEAGQVCQNTRGSYHCHQIDCPVGYRLESKHRCSRIQRSCPVSDWTCLEQPSTYSYHFITFVSNIYLPSGSVDLFTMHGPAWRDAEVSFELRMMNVQATPGVQPTDLRCFDMRPSNNICVISLLCSLEGPQVAEMELTMSLHQHGQFAGSAVARLVVIVSQYEF